MTSGNELVFRIAATVALAGGFAATNQVCGLAGSLLSGRETGNVMGVVGLGTGIFGYLGPQLLGILHDRTQGFSAGWYMMAGLAFLTFIELLLLKRHSEKARVERTAVA